MNNIDNIDQLVGKIVTFKPWYKKGAWLITGADGDCVKAVAITKQYSLSVCKTVNTLAKNIETIDEERSAKWAVIKARRAAA